MGFFVSLLPSSPCFRLCRIALPIDVSPVVFPLFSHLMSRFTCLDSCFCSLVNDHLDLICGGSLFPLQNGKCPPCSLIIVVVFVRDFNDIISCCRLRFASDLLRSCFAAVCFCREVVRPCFAALCFCREVVRLRLCYPLFLS